MAFAVFRMPPWLPLFVHESNGVDPSWQMLLNEAGLNGWIFGRDLFFTYGPFGFIHARMYHPETWAVLATVWVGISVIMADLVWRVSGHGRLSSVGRALFGIVILEFMSRDAMAVCFGLHALVFYEAVGCSCKDAMTQSAVESLRSWRALDADGPDALSVISACDPANPYGSAGRDQGGGSGGIDAGAPQERNPYRHARVPSNYLVVQRGVPIILYH